MAVQEESMVENLATRLATYYGFEATVFTDDNDKSRICLFSEDYGEFSDYEYDDWSQLIIENEDLPTLNEIVDDHDEYLISRGIEVLQYSSLEELSLKLTAKGF